MHPSLGSSTDLVRPLRKRYESPANGSKADKVLPVAINFPHAVRSIWHENTRNIVNVHTLVSISLLNASVRFSRLQHKAISTLAGGKEPSHNKRVYVVLNPRGHDAHPPRGNVTIKYTNRRSSTQTTGHPSVALSKTHKTTIENYSLHDHTPR